MLNNGYYHEVSNDGYRTVTVNETYSGFTLVYEERRANVKKTEYYNSAEEAMERAQWYLRRA